MPAATARPPIAHPNAPAMRRLCELLKLGADPTRARVLLELEDGERDGSQLLEVVQTHSLTSLSPHLRLLRLAELVEVRPEGIRAMFSLTPRGRVLLGAIQAMPG